MTEILKSLMGLLYRSVNMMSLFSEPFYVFGALLIDYTRPGSTIKTGENDPDESCGVLARRLEGWPGGLDERFGVEGDGTSRYYSPYAHGQVVRRQISAKVLKS